MSEKWTIDQLISLAALALEATPYNGQPTARARETPDKRTVRYYTTLGLLDRPAEFRGRTAYYGRRHVMQLAAIKRLQAKGMTLVQIQAALAGADDERLARWAAIPAEFWNRESQALEQPADFVRLADQNSGPETDPKAQSTVGAPSPRPALFWRAAPTWQGQAEPIAPSSTEPSPSRRALPEQVVALRLAEGVTLVLEGLGCERFEPSVLAEIKPAAEALVAQLRRLGLVA